MEEGLCCWTKYKIEGNSNHFETAQKSTRFKSIFLQKDGNELCSLESLGKSDIACTCNISLAEGEAKIVKVRLPDKEASQDFEYFITSGYYYGTLMYVVPFKSSDKALWRGGRVWSREDQEEGTQEEAACRSTDAAGIVKPDNSGEFFVKEGSINDHNKDQHHVIQLSLSQKEMKNYPNWICIWYIKVNQDNLKTQTLGWYYIAIPEPTVGIDDKVKIREGGGEGGGGKDSASIATVVTANAVGDKLDINTSFSISSTSIANDKPILSTVTPTAIPILSSENKVERISLSSSSTSSSPLLSVANPSTLPKNINVAVDDSIYSLSSPSIETEVDATDKSAKVHVPVDESFKGDQIEIQNEKAVADIEEQSRLTGVCNKAEKEPVWSKYRYEVEIGLNNSKKDKMKLKEIKASGTLLKDGNGLHSLGSLDTYDFACTCSLSEKAGKKVKDISIRLPNESDNQDFDVYFVTAEIEASFLNTARRLKMQMGEVERLTSYVPEFISNTSDSNAINFSDFSKPDDGGAYFRKDSNIVTLGLSTNVKWLCVWYLKLNKTSSNAVEKVCWHYIELPEPVNYYPVTLKICEGSLQLYSTMIKGKIDEILELHSIHHPPQNCQNGQDEEEKTIEKLPWTPYVFDGDKAVEFSGLHAAMMNERRETLELVLCRTMLNPNNSLLEVELCWPKDEGSTSMCYDIKAGKISKGYFSSIEDWSLLIPELKDLSSNHKRISNFPTEASMALVSMNASHSSPDTSNAISRNFKIDPLPKPIANPTSNPTLNEVKVVVLWHYGVTEMKIDRNSEMTVREMKERLKEELDNGDANATYSLSASGGEGGGQLDKASVVGATPPATHFFLYDDKYKELRDEQSKVSNHFFVEVQGVSIPVPIISLNLLICKSIKRDDETIIDEISWPTFHSSHHDNESSHLVYKVEACLISGSLFSARTTLWPPANFSSIDIDEDLQVNNFGPILPQIKSHAQHLPRGGGRAFPGGGRPHLIGDSAPITGCYYDQSKARLSLSLIEGTGKATVQISPHIHKSSDSTFTPCKEHPAILYTFELPSNIVRPFPLVKVTISRHDSIAGSTVPIVFEVRRKSTIASLRKIANFIDCDGENPATVAADVGDGGGRQSDKHKRYYFFADNYKLRTALVDSYVIDGDMHVNLVEVDVEVCKTSKTVTIKCPSYKPGRNDTGKGIIKVAYLVQADNSDFGNWNKLTGGADETIVVDNEPPMISNSDVSNCEDDGLHCDAGKVITISNLALDVCKIRLWIRKLISAGSGKYSSMEQFQDELSPIQLILPIGTDSSWGGLIISQGNGVFEALTVTHREDTKKALSTAANLAIKFALPAGVSDALNLIGAAFDIKSSLSTFSVEELTSKYYGKDFCNFPKTLSAIANYSQLSVASVRSADLIQQQYFFPLEFRQHMLRLHFQMKEFHDTFFTGVGDNAADALFEFLSKAYPVSKVYLSVIKKAYPWIKFALIKSIDIIAVILRLMYWCDSDILRMVNLFKERDFIELKKLFEELKNAFSEGVKLISGIGRGRLAGGGGKVPVEVEGRNAFEKAIECIKILQKIFLLMDNNIDNPLISIIRDFMKSLNNMISDTAIHMEHIHIEGFLLKTLEYPMPSSMIRIGSGFAFIIENVVPGIEVFLGKTGRLLKNTDFDNLFDEKIAPVLDKCHEISRFFTDENLRRYSGRQDWKESFGSLIEDGVIEQVRGLLALLNEFVLYSNVPLNKIRKLERASSSEVDPESDESSSYCVGERVQVQFTDGKWYNSSVRCVKSDLIDVKWEWNESSSLTNIFDFMDSFVLKYLIIAANDMSILIEGWEAPDNRDEVFGNLAKLFTIKNRLFFIMREAKSIFRPDFVVKEFRVEAIQFYYDLLELKGVVLSIKNSSKTRNILSSEYEAADKILGKTIASINFLLEIVEPLLNLLYYSYDEILEFIKLGSTGTIAADIDVMRAILDQSGLDSIDAKINFYIEIMSAASRILMESEPVVFALIRTLGFSNNAVSRNRLIGEREFTIPCGKYSNLIKSYAANFKCTSLYPLFQRLLGLFDSARDLINLNSPSSICSLGTIDNIIDGELQALRNLIPQICGVMNLLKNLSYTTDTTAVANNSGDADKTLFEKLNEKLEIIDLNVLQEDNREKNARMVSFILFGVVLCISSLFPLAAVLTRLFSSVYQHNPSLNILNNFEPPTCIGELGSISDTGLCISQNALRSNFQDGSGSGDPMGSISIKGGFLQGPPPKAILPLALSFAIVIGVASFASAMLYRLLLQLLQIDRKRMSTSMVTYCLMRTVAIVVTVYAAGIMAEKGSAWMELIMVLLVIIVGAYMIYCGASGIQGTLKKINCFMSEVIETVSTREGIEGVSSS